MDICVHPSTLKGSIVAPGSKSVMQRAIVASLLGSGRSILREPAWCDDSLAALGACATLGSTIDFPEAMAFGKDAWQASRSQGHGDLSLVPPGPVTITGCPPDTFRPADAAEEVHLDCGESGTCLRILTPVGALYRHPVVLDARGSLCRRPVGDLEGPLSALGAVCTTREGFAPVRVAGPLRGGRCTVDASATSQILSGLLTALPFAEGDSALEVANLASKPYIALTLSVLTRFGIKIEQHAFREFHIPGNQRFLSPDLRIEADWSATAFPAVAAAISAGGEGLEISGPDADSAQADRALLEVLALAGADVEVREGSLFVRRSELRAFSFDARDCPDLFPPLAVLAAFCDGRTTLYGASRLSHKESDRAKAIAEEFGSLGVKVEVEGDRMTIDGPATIAGGRISSRGDHRIAMAGAVLALRASSPITISGAESVAKSWPGYFEAMKGIGMLSEVLPSI